MQFNFCKRNINLVHRRRNKEKEMKSYELEPLDDNIANVLS